jgi:hypothetical protein
LNVTCCCVGNVDTNKSVHGITQWCPADVLQTVVTFG